MTALPIPTEISFQLTAACKIIKRHTSSDLISIHLFGSALNGGLKPYSDIDLLVTVNTSLDEAKRRTLMTELLSTSAPLGSEVKWRPLEVTVIIYSDVIPWHYPDKRELQFGEWLRDDILNGVFEPPMLDHDLAILLTKVRQHNVALVGQPAETLFDPVPQADFLQSLADTIVQWNDADDWRGDEQNIILALARIWYSATTGLIAPKDVAADWLLERISPNHRPVLRAARNGYRGLTEDDLVTNPELVTEFIHFAKREIGRLLGAHA